MLKPSQSIDHAQGHARPHELPVHHRRSEAGRLSVGPAAPVCATPALDALAAEGVLFARHYRQAVPGGPSRASPYTSLYLMNHRSVINGTPLEPRNYPPDQPEWEAGRPAPAQESPHRWLSYQMKQNGARVPKPEATLRRLKATAACDGHSLLPWFQSVQGRIRRTTGGQIERGL